MTERLNKQIGDKGPHDDNVSYSRDDVKGTLLTKMPCSGDCTKTIIMNSWYDIGEEGYEFGDDNPM